ncbi:uncharacterized protein LOC135498407 [Lineus longissimus]|uniref:uncharacterized protein LOC135498407 n=1 Tax=Lineus longissimus TaxID=88925 RepID=UPI00315D32E8
MHLLLILHPDDKPCSPDDYNKYVTAEIPRPSQTSLFNTITQSMKHGPCGTANPNSPCMDQGQCTKNYPKTFSETTEQSPDGYPIYRRRDNGEEIDKNGVLLDNRWVVPYNPHLAAKYQAHINVEICSTVTAVKHLYKYVYKGQDRIMASIQEPNENNAVNEIHRFIDARYISPGEATLRLFHYDLNSRSPAIQRLAVHLPNQQSIVFTPGSAQEALDRAKDTTLTAWFQANKMYPEARNILYHEFPEHYTWNKSPATWTPRKRMFAIGRMYTASPAQGERYYLRLLLLHIPGCTCFEDLRRQENGDVAPTFKMAAVLRGYLEDDREWDTCLQEAKATAHPKQIRNLFAIILIFC